MKPINLCDTCKFEFAICFGNPIFDETLVTKDNVTDCDKYKME